ncbi:hypothetical protein IW261DRAFT_1425425 [Armillaria novae-zelandiae]|uniref:Heterokaryon incompatibility domain-containing protein n=1 Tax=Armillaria novae-zelandiae TaxID=153914 RepID=A0AA39NSU6_9AGAR|nr:hypothetical protein IW261DRAFT_1425425 [Armillaria novae-zelandiae]
MSHRGPNLSLYIDSDARTRLWEYGVGPIRNLEEPGWELPWGADQYEGRRTTSPLGTRGRDRCGWTAVGFPLRTSPDFLVTRWAGSWMHAQIVSPLFFSTNSYVPTTHSKGQDESTTWAIFLLFLLRTGSVVTPTSHSSVTALETTLPPHPPQICSVSLEKIAVDEHRIEKYDADDPQEPKPKNNYSIFDTKHLDPNTNWGDRNKWAITGLRILVPLTCFIPVGPFTVNRAIIADVRPVLCRGPATCLFSASVFMGPSSADWNCSHFRQTLAARIDLNPFRGTTRVGMLREEKIVNEPGHAPVRARKMRGERWMGVNAHGSCSLTRNDVNWMHPIYHTSGSFSKSTLVIKYDATQLLNPRSLPHRIDKSTGKIVNKPAAGCIRQLDRPLCAEFMEPLHYYQLIPHGGASELADCEFRTTDAYILPPPRRLSLERASSKRHKKLRIWKHLCSIATGGRGGRGVFFTETKESSYTVSDQNTNITDSDVDDDSSNDDSEDCCQQFTLSAFTETGRAESSIEVPKQRSYTGSSPVILCSLADTPCATLGVQGVLDRLNTILGTSTTLYTVPSSFTVANLALPSSASVQDQLSLESILEGFIERDYDFGLAYALLRPVWNKVNHSDIQCELRIRKERDMWYRQSALVGNWIVNPNLEPRRLWDLYSNRVVPWWIVGDCWLLPISHAWVDEKDRVDMRTLINGKEWPVPIPKDADLNLIRIEMLNLEAEYTWLDVLCLRQKEEGGPKEDLRVEEWRLDVPTIGFVYGWRQVVVYLNGLGRPLRLKDGDLDSDRSWFRRAWTVQEAGSWRIIAGDTPDGPMHAQQIGGGNYKTALLTRFHDELHSVHDVGLLMFTALANMQKRVSTSPVDRVAGLAFLLDLRRIPVYHESETLENAWTALVNAMQPDKRVLFLLLYPAVGLECKKWRPSWSQVMMEPLPKDIIYSHNPGIGVHYDNETHEDWFDGVCIEEGHVRGFNVGSAEEHDRCGELVLEAADGIVYTFKTRVTHQFLIPEDTYTLLGCDPLRCCMWWAIGRRLPDQKFEKVSVIEMDSDTELERLREYTGRFNSVTRSRYMLI